MKPKTMSELAVYEAKKELAAAIREDFLNSKAGKKFDYIRVFTEPRAKGGLRSKFWYVGKDQRKSFINWMKANYPGVKVKEIGVLGNYGCYPSPSVAFYL